VLVSGLLADPAGRPQRHRGAPRLPAFYNEAIDGIATGEGVGSCGTVAHRREPVIVTDIATDPFWDDFRDLAGRAGLAACWSTPILARDGGLPGTFAMYHRSPRAPQEADLALTRVFAGTAALAAPRTLPARRCGRVRRAGPDQGRRLVGRRGLGLPGARRGGHHQRALGVHRQRGTRRPGGLHQPLTGLNR
jgi:GAF domain-containing protein